MANFDYTSPSVSIPFRSNGGGLNSTGSPTSLQDNESSGLQNIDFDKFGSFKKRNGYTALNTSAFNSGAAWNGLYFLELSSGTDYLLGTCGNKLAKMDSLDGTWDDITGALTVTAGNDNHVSWATHLNTAIGTNNVDVPFIWTGTGNGSAMTVPTGLTKAKYVNIFANYTTLANVTVSGTLHASRVYWSTIDSISAWSSSDFRDLGKNDGQEITGSKTLGSSWVVFKDRSIWVGSFTGDSDIPFIFDKSRSPVGAVSGYDIEEVENGLIFHSYDGMYFFDGNNSFKISDRIQSTFEDMNANRFKDIVGIYYRRKNRYLGSFTLSGSSTHDRNITWNSDLNAYSIYKGINANCFARVYSSGQERIYFGDYSGYVYRMDTGTDDYPANAITAIDAYYYTKWFDYGDLISKKATPEVKIYHQIANTSLTFSYSYNFESADQYSQIVSLTGGSSVYDTALYDTATYANEGGAVKRRDVTGRGEVVRFKFSNSQTSETFTIDAFAAFPHAETSI